LAKEIANQLRLHKIAISIDDLGAEWLSLIGLCNFPFVELKVDRKFVAGCAEDRLKQSMCRRILDLADGYEARGLSPRELRAGQIFSPCVRWVSIWRKGFSSPNP
jgi:EAL domain-containing protein (putative c-di-GMP-specific phosphodiesterase class I)